MIVILLMGRKRTNNLEGRVADVDMAGRGAEKDVIRARGYGSYVCALQSVSKFGSVILSFIGEPRPRRVVAEVHYQLHRVL